MRSDKNNALVKRNLADTVMEESMINQSESIERHQMVASQLRNCPHYPAPLSTSRLRTTPLELSTGSGSVSSRGEACPVLPALCVIRSTAKPTDID